MREVLVVCEGQTEREFCRRVVKPWVVTRGLNLNGTLVGNPNSKRGGIRRWEAYRNELVKLGRERADRHLAVLVDYYRMPNDWPGRQEASKRVAEERGRHIERALVNDLGPELGRRFHPCVQLHEFESLLFVDPKASAASIAVGAGQANSERVARRLQEVRQQSNDDVEQINDSPDGAPSKRLKRIVRGYDKVAWGVAAVQDVGLERLQDDCPWLMRWMDDLRSIERMA